MLKAVLFDVDGVLLIGERWDKELASTYGITPDALASFFAGPFQRCLVGEADLKAELAPYLPRWGWQHSIDDFLSYWFRQYVVNKPLLRAIGRLRQRGLACYLATQQEGYRAAYLLHELGFAHCFDGMFSTAGLGCLKREARFFTAIVDSLQAYRPAEILFWDDTPAHVATARSVGLQAEVYRGFAAFQQRMSGYLDQAEE